MTAIWSVLLNAWDSIGVSTWVVFWCVLMVLLILGLTWWDTRIRPSFTIAPGSRMQLWKAIFLLLFLSVTGALSIHAIYGLWHEPQPPTRAPSVEPGTCNSGDPEITGIDPSSVFLGSGRSNIRVFGCNFAKEDTVNFDGVERVPVFVDGKQLVVPLATSDFGAPGTVMIGVVYPGEAGATAKKTSNQKPLNIQSASQQEFPWYFLWWTITITSELRLLLLVLFAGCLGSSIFALKSVADYVGDQKLYESWFSFYLVQPLEGAGVAFIFYLVLRGGFLAGTTVDVKSTNPFGIIAMAALVGVFSDDAFLKLHEVFETLFKPQDKRGDKIGGALTITSGSPLPNATVGAPYKQNLQASNGAPPYTWAPATIPTLPAGLAVNGAGVLSGNPTAATPVTKYTFKVVDNTGASALADLELAVNGPPTVSTTTPLPDAKAGSNYNVRLQVANGTPPYTWDTTTTPPLPPGLTLDSSGQLSGKPASPATRTSYTFKASDANGASVAAPLDLTVQ